MEGISRVVFVIMMLNAATALIEPRKMLHIPEKIIGGVIEMVQNHKNKPTQGYQSQSQMQVQGTQQYPTWNPPVNQGPTQSQTQTQFGNYANYPSAPAGTYPSNVGQTYPAQGNYVGPQTQGQYQGFGQQSAGQFQAQNQNYNSQTNNQFQGQQNNYQAQNQVQLQGQGQNVNQPNFAQGQSQFQNQGQYVGQNQNQMQVQTGQYGQNAQNYQPTQFTGQNYQNGQFSGQNTFQGMSGPVNMPSSGPGLVQMPSSRPGPVQMPSSGPGPVQMPSLPNGNGQNGVFQGAQPMGAPSCVCQAWGKEPSGGLNGAGKSEEITEKNTINIDS